MFINWPVNPDYNITIECQGEQHFKPVEPWGGEKQFETNKKRDELKKELCKENGVELFYYTEPRFMKYLLENNEASFSNIEKIYEKIFSKSSTYQKKGTPPWEFSFLIRPYPQGFRPRTRGHFLKTQFLYKKIHAQQSAPKPPYVGRMNGGRGDRGEGSPGRATRFDVGF